MKREELDNADMRSQTTQATDKTEELQDCGPERALKGLQNQGGTCYMNSLLQALFMTPEFRALVFKWR